MKGVPFKLVFVEWEDSYGAGSDWAPLDEPHLDDAAVCVSVGWLAAENRDRLVVVPHMTVVNGLKATNDGCGDMTIPRSAVRRLIVLRSIPDRKKRKRRNP